MCNLLKGAEEAGRGVLGGSKLHRTGTDGWKARLFILQSPQICSDLLIHNELQSERLHLRLIQGQTVF